MKSIKDRKPKVSVVVRAYNVEKYILECLESLCNQTLKDIEILVCEDCSTDGTLDIAKSVAEKDSRVRILAKDKNQGTLLNRKSGVDAATGEYVMFLDGDDYYSTEACEKAYNAIKEQNTDILQFGTNVFAEKDGFEDFIKGVKEYLKYPEEKIIVPVNGGLLSYKYVKEKMNLPPFLILHGDKDHVVPITQSIELYEKLKEYHYEVTFGRVHDADHGRSIFYNEDVYQTIIAFLDKHK